MEEEVELDPVEFELPNGHNVRVEHAWYWHHPTWEEKRDGVTKHRYSAIRIFSTEDTNPRRLELCDELRSGVAFVPACLEAIWDWVLGVVPARRHRAYDGTEDFLDEFEEAIARLCAEGEDAVEHIAHLPEQEPVPPDGEDAFDPEDDSNFNDQNDSDDPWLTEPKSD